MNAGYVLTAGLFLALPLNAQNEEVALNAKRRNECRLAAQVLDTGHPRPHREWALRYISRCENEGPAVLAAQWRNAPVAGAELEAIVWSSLRLRDARLYDQLRATAADHSRPSSMRVAAMLVLARYTDPRNAIWLSDLVPPDSIRRIPLVLSSSTGFYPITGEVPLSGSIAPQVLALLDEVAAARSKEEAPVWYAAAVLAKRLRRDMEAGHAH